MEFALFSSGKTIFEVFAIIFFLSNFFLPQFGMEFALFSSDKTIFEVFAKIFFLSNFFLPQFGMEFVLFSSSPAEECPRLLFLLPKLSFFGYIVFCIVMTACGTSRPKVLVQIRAEEKVSLLVMVALVSESTDYYRQSRMDNETRV